MSLHLCVCFHGVHVSHITFLIFSHHLSIQVHTCYKVITKSQLTLYLYFLEKFPCTQSTEDTLGNLPKIHHPTKLFPIISNQIEFLFSFMFFLSIQICVCVYGQIYIRAYVYIYIHSYF